MPVAIASQRTAAAARGITLIELCTCLAVIATTAAIAIPAMTASLQRHHALAAEHLLIRHLNLARMAAVSHRRAVVLCPSSDGHHCTRGGHWDIGWLLFLDGDGNRVPDQPGDILRVEAAPTARHVQLLGTPGRSSIRYLPDGRSSGSNLTVSICDHQGGLLAQVIVNNAGRVRSTRASTTRPCPGARNSRHASVAHVVQDD